MPRVPTYDNLMVDQAVLPNAQVRAYDAPNVVGKEAIELGEGMESAGTALSKAAVRQMELDNQAALDKEDTAAREWILEYQKDNAQRVGENASGMTQQFSEGFDKYTAERLGKLPAHLKPFYERKVVGLAMDSIAKLSAYEAGQKQTARVSANEANGKALIEFAVRANPGQDFDNALTKVTENITARADLIGVKDTEQIQRMKDEAASNIYMMRVRNLMNTNPDQALGYFKAVQSRILSSDAKAHLETVVNKVDTENRVEGQVEKLWDMHKGNLDERDKLRSQIMGLFAGDEQKIALAIFDQLNTSEARGREAIIKRRLDAAWTVVAQTGSLKGISNTEKAWLQENDPQGWLALKDKVKSMQGATSRKTDPNKYYELTEMQSKNPKGFASLDLRKWLPHLSESDFEYFARQQGEANKPDKVADLQTLQQQLSMAHNGMKLGKDDADKKYLFDSAVMTAIQARGGSVSYDDRQKIIDKLMIEGEVVVKNWFDEPKRLYEVKGTPDEARWKQNIPKADRDGIIAGLKKAGKPTDEASIQKAYLHLLDIRAQAK